MQFELRNPTVPFIFMQRLENAQICFLNYKHYPMVPILNPCTQERNVEVSHFLYIRLKFSKLIHLDAFYNIYFIFPNIFF